jgi:hypothetical protein
MSMPDAHILTLAAVRDRIVGCNRCERLRSYCARVGDVKKAAHRDDTYWARSVPGFGDPMARALPSRLLRSPNRRAA